MNNLASLEINLRNLKDNIKSLKKLVKNDSQFMAVVKADAYGHGLIECARTAVQSGADWLGVVTIDEAIDCRNAGLAVPILVLGYVPLEKVELAAERNIAIPILDEAYAQKVSKMMFPFPLRAHLKVETGLHRMGMQKEESLKVYEILSKNSNILIEGIYSHFASVEEDNRQFTEDQVKEFKSIVKEFESKEIKFAVKHISASAAAMRFLDYQFNLVRFGIAIYGLWPSEETKKEMLKIDPKLELKPVMSFKTVVAQVKNMPKGSKVGYGCTYEAKYPMKIAILPIGYYDGIDRGFSNPCPTESGKSGEVLIYGKRCSIVGRICMNMTIVNISNLDREARRGDEVVVLGCQFSEEITADEIAKKLNTINYEVVARMPAHIKREYKR